MGFWNFRAFLEKVEKVGVCSSGWNRRGNEEKSKGMMMMDDDMSIVPFPLFLLPLPFLGWLVVDMDFLGIWIV